jgi:hypothetical protein
VRLLALDPGTTHTGFCVLDNGQPADAGVMENGEVLDALKANPLPVAIEMVASYGMAVGAEVFRTVWWTGRFAQVAGIERVREVYRREVKLHLCNSPKAKDTNVRQALIDRWGGKAQAIGTSKQRGPLYGIKSHAWAALAVGVYVWDTQGRVA